MLEDAVKGKKTTETKKPAKQEAPAQENKGGSNPK
jgi:hypothetical protein